jgi:ubiquinone/menaquinone biosynthesis C-methylase UbiE
MDKYGASTYGDRIAEFYDAWFHPPTDSQAAVDFLADLAMPGPALELAIGTGRIALPLAAKGVQVLVIDASEAMVAKLREKPGGA